MVRQKEQRLGDRKIERSRSVNSGFRIGACCREKSGFLELVYEDGVGLIFIVKA
jgi:hypothetical protein